MDATNDATNQAQEAQENHTPLSISNLEIRPPTPARERSPRAKLALPSVTYGIVLFTFLVLGIVLLEVVNHRIHAKAAALPAPQPSIDASANPAPAAAVPLKTAESAMPAAAATGTEALSPATGEIASPEVGNAAPPQLPPLRLQAVFYNPARPSAIIAGITVFVGDRVHGFRVTLIQMDAATLVNGTQTNVLKLSQ